MNRNLGNFLMKKYYLLQESNNYLESMFSNPGITNFKITRRPLELDKDFMLIIVLRIASR